MMCGLCLGKASYPGHVTKANDILAVTDSKPDYNEQQPPAIGDNMLQEHCHIWPLVITVTQCMH